MIVFEILGKPEGKGRPRVTKYGTYTPIKTKNYEELIKWSFINKYKNKMPLEGAIKIEIIAIFEVPKSYSKKQKEEALKDKIYTKKSDLDNIIKVILDALNKIAYKDDAQVVQINAKKEYGIKNKVIVRLEEI